VWPIFGLSGEKMLTQITDLQVIPTRNFQKQLNGFFVPVYKNLEQILSTSPLNSEITMVYVTSCFPNEIKGPHLHVKRTGNLTVIKGRVIFILEHIVEDVPVYEEFVLTGDKPQLIQVPKGVKNCHINIGGEEAYVLNLCTEHCWAPSDTDNSSSDFQAYDVNKWKKG